MKGLSCLIVLGFSLLFISKSWAHDPHRIKQGETLYRIAKNHHVGIEALKKTNHLSGSFIRQGRTLHIPSSTRPGKTVARKSGERTKTIEPIASSDPGKIQDGGATGGESALKGAEPIVDKGANAPAQHEQDEIGTYLSGLDEDAGNDASEEQENPLIAFARKYLGVPYRFGGENLTRGIDCSAFVQKVFRHFNVDLPRTAREQFKAGVKVSQNDIQIGDLIFFRTYARYPSHVGIYVGGGKMIHASSRYHQVSVSDLDRPYYQSRFIGVIRIPGEAGGTVPAVLE